ncbi:unnamed protein product [Lathyrus sativus]|nr:unnamed protein product [Lathyrus sativus]
MHLRLELLEGVVAFHTGQLEKSKQALASAREKFVQLQVPDEALSLVLLHSTGLFTYQHRTYAEAIKKVIAQSIAS